MTRDKKDKFINDLLAAGVDALDELRDLMCETKDEKIRKDCAKAIMEYNTKLISPQEADSSKVTINFNVDKLTEGIKKMKKITGGTVEEIPDKSASEGTDI